MKERFGIGSGHFRGSVMASKGEKTKRADQRGHAHPFEQALLGSVPR